MHLRRLVTSDGHPCYLSPGRVISIVPAADVVSVTGVRSLCIVTVMEREILGSGQQGERTRHSLIEGDADTVATALFGPTEAKRGG